MNLEKWVKYCSSLRDKIVIEESGEKNYLLANFSGTAQAKDIQIRTPLVSDFYRIKINVKAIDDEEMTRQGKKAIDPSKDFNAAMEAIKKEFDMPIWAAVKMKSSEIPLKDFNHVFISQLKGCNIHCPWCYVDDVNKKAKFENNAEYFSMREIVNFFESERRKRILNMIRISGGEPTLAVEQWKEQLGELSSRGLDKKVFAQGETNLTTGTFIQNLQANGKISKNLLEAVGEYDNFGLLCSFKGTDVSSFLRATGMSKEYAFLEEERWKTFDMFVRAGIDCYPFVYDPEPISMEQFLDKGISKFGDNFARKTWVLPLKLYGPEKNRLAKKGINSEDYQRGLDSRFHASVEIINDFLNRKFGLDYQEEIRPGIELSAKPKP